MKYVPSEMVTASDNPADIALKRIARLAARLLKTPVVVISQGDGEKQSVCSCIGLTLPEAQKTLPFCAHAATSTDILVVPDLRQDARFAENPLVSDKPGLRFYVGAPLIASDEQRIGALILLDGEEHEFGEEEYSALRDLAALAADEIELYRENVELHQVEAQLERSERIFRTMVENATDIIARTDNDLRFIFMSPSIESITGNPPDYFLGKTIRDLELPEELLVYWEGKRLEVLETGQSAILEFSYHAPAGRTYYFESIAIPEFGPDGSIETILSVARDITVRKHAELELERQKAILQSIFDHVPVMIDFHDENRQFHLVNREWERVMGWTMEEVANHPNIFETFFPDAEYRQQAIEHMQRACERWVETKTKVRDGRIIDTAWKNVRLPDGTHIGIGQDITERKKAEEEQSHLVAILEATTDCVAIADIAGRVVYINQAGRQMLGIGLDEDTSNTDVIDYYPRENSVTINVGLPAALRDGIWSGESVLRTRDGEEFPVSQVIIAHKTTQGEVEFISTIARNISERKQAEEALLRAKEEAERANEAKSEFLSRMSHELRTPLNAILGFSQLFDKQDLSSYNAESLDQIVKAGRHLLALIDEVLDIANIDAGRLTLSLEAIAVQVVAEEVLGLMQPLASERQIQFKNLIDDNYYVRADYQRFKQIVLNLVSNAVKYNREAGTVSLSAKVDDHSLRLEVTDTGEGITPANLEKLFSPFERLDAEKRGIKGSGVGLVLSKRLAEVMGGALGVESTPGAGSTFWVSLPRDENPLERLTNGEDAFSAARATIEPGGCLIYIEDNLPNLKLVENILKHRPNFRLMAATRGDLGLELIFEHLPDLVLLDLHLPSMSGEEVFRQMQADPRTKSIPVVVISADTSSRQIHRLLSAGIKHYLVKPFNVKQLLHIVDELIQHQSTQEHNN